MDKSDYLNFISEKFKIKDPENSNLDIKQGSFSIWICNKKENYGYKFFFKEWGGPSVFFVSNKFISKKLDSKYKGQKLLEMDKLKDYFKFCNKLFNLGIIAKPLKIFNYKSIYGIKFQKLLPVTSDKLWDNRYNILLPIFNKIWIEDYSKWLLDQSQRQNFGQINNNLLMLDLDATNLDRTL